MSTRKALLAAGGIIAFSLTLAWLQKGGYIGHETTQRAIQVGIGLLVVYAANLAPKTLEPLSESCDPARVQALQRFSGWAIVIGGLGYSLAWLVAPFERAAMVSMAVLGFCVLLVVSRWAWTVRKGKNGQPSAGL